MFNRRDFLIKGLSFAAGTIGLKMLPVEALSDSRSDEKILVVLELSGGNDGLNTVVPYGDDAYFKARPRIGIKKDKLLKIDDHFGFNPGLRGIHRLWKEGKVAIIHGCGYDKPSYSHFNSIAYWRTGVPHQGDEYGWVGRTADSMTSSRTANILVNIDTTQSLAVKSKCHTPVVFSEPEKFKRNILKAQESFFNYQSSHLFNEKNRRYLRDISVSAKEASSLFQNAWTSRRSQHDYGLFSVNLDKIASFIAAQLPTRLYYTAYPNNSFDTHVAQPAVHQRILSYVSDAIYAFVKDMELLGFSDRVILMVFSEFGRRVPENEIMGTDHGTANNMFIIGGSVLGGHYGALPSLTELNELDNLIYTTDFRRVYATVIDKWLGQSSREVLKGDFEPFSLFQES